MKEINRRTFLTGMAAATAVTTLPKGNAKASVGGNTYATLIDLTQCDGCPDKQTPACVSACRATNAHKHPKPKEKKIRDYWPQPFHEDWRDRQHLTNRLTPYNWLFVQKVEVEWKGKRQQLNIPRRCMHCDNPPCSKLCPFGVNKKTPEGPVYIDTDLCLGGAKCRQVCPWSVPQRQAGVGIYTHLEPLPVGGGVMYKCDLCRDRLAHRELPACVEACPRGAMRIGKRYEIEAAADQLARKLQGFVYGRQENGGTSTLYVSKVPFDVIDKALVTQAKSPKVMRMHKVNNLLTKHNFWAKAILAAPMLGVVGAVAAAISKREKDR